MIGDESDLGDVVIDSSAEAKARDVVRVNEWLLGEQLQSSSEKNCATDDTDTGKAREVCAHNFHTYKNDDMPATTLLTIQIFVSPENSPQKPLSKLHLDARKCGAVAGATST